MLQLVDFAQIITTQMMIMSGKLQLLPWLMKNMYD